MTRLSQALRWWRGRKCECSEGCTRKDWKHIRHTSIPKRHFWVLLDSGRLKKVVSVSPLAYHLVPPDEP